jgi:hypothetical protein
MKNLIITLITLSGVAANAATPSITKTQIPSNNRLATQVEGSIVIDSVNAGRMLTKTFFGADTNGFFKLPSQSNVVPMNLGFVKFGGALHSVYNWKNDLYKDPVSGILETYLPLKARINIAKNDYRSTPMFQVNMLGVQPELNANGKVVMAQTADAKHAANAIRFLNEKNLNNVTNIIMGNEPFGEINHGEKSPSADEYISKYIQYAIALRDAQVSIGGKADDLKLWGPEISTGWTNWQTNHPTDCTQNAVALTGQSCSYGNGQFTEFIPYFLYRLALAEKNVSLNPHGYRLLDVLTLHYYPLFRKFTDKNSIIVDAAGKENVPAMLGSVNLWNSSTYTNKVDNASPKGISPNIINRFSAWRDSQYPSAKIAVTEFGIDSVSGIQYHEIVRPLYLADLVGRLAESGVDTFVNSFLQNETFNAQWGMINNETRTNLYYVFTLFSRNYLGQVLTTKDTFGDAVNAYAVKTAIGMNVFLINKDMVSHTTSVETEGSKTELSLPAWSLTVVTIPNNKDTVSVQTFGAKEMGIPVSVGAPTKQ